MVYFFGYYFGFWNDLWLNSANYDIICLSRCYFWFSLPGFFFYKATTGLILLGNLALFRGYLFGRNTPRYFHLFHGIIIISVSVPIIYPSFLLSLSSCLSLVFLFCVNRCKTSRPVISLQDFGSHTINLRHRAQMPFSLSGE